MSNPYQHARYFGEPVFHGASLWFHGHEFVPDLTKGYFDFHMAHAFHIRPDGKPGGITAYGTATTAKTLHNSYRSLLHQNINIGHRVKSYDASPEKKNIPRDYALGSVVAVEYPPEPDAGFPLQISQNGEVPHIHGAGVIHKQWEKVDRVIGEHQSGRHKWSVSLEMKFPREGSGFLVHDRRKGTARQRAALDELKPVTWGGMSLNDLDMGYIVVESCPDDLLKVYNSAENRMKGRWGDLPVTYLQGGLDGHNHFMGVGVVKYPAEREAEIGRILAHDPDALDILMEDESLLVIKNYFAEAAASAGKFVEALKR